VLGVHFGSIVMLGDPVISRSWEREAHCWVQSTRHS
jgi:hypothetical protein